MVHDFVEKNLHRASDRLLLHNSGFLCNPVQLGADAGPPSHWESDDEELQAQDDVRQVNA